MNIRVWSNFSKRINSTRQPAAADGRQISCYLKEETSIRNPSFILADPMPSITYVQAFGNYYFVDDIINMDANRAEVSCSLDVLATYRASILGYTAFVERSASDYDVYLRDPALSCRQLYSVDDVTNTDVSSIFNPTGCYITTILGKEYGLAIYATNTLNCYKIFLDSGVYNSTDIAQWVRSGIAAAFDLDVYIGCVMWMPLNLSSIGLAANALSIGPISVLTTSPDLGGATIRIASPSYRVGELKAISLPSTNLYNDFRDCDPRFVQYSITLPGVGTVQLDSAFVGSCIHNGRTLYDYIMIDLSTGQITHQIETLSNNQGDVFCELKGQIGVNVPLGKSKANVIETLTTFIGGTGAAVSGLLGGGGSGGSIAGAASTSLLTGINTIDAAYSPQTSMIGGSGNHTDLYVNSQTIKINRKILGSKEFALSVAGRPLMQNVQLSTLSGYCQCGNASVPVNARDAERAEINAYLNSGFYVE